MEWEGSDIISYSDLPLYLQIGSAASAVAVVRGGLEDRRKVVPLLSPDSSFRIYSSEYLEKGRDLVDLGYQARLHRVRIKSRKDVGEWSERVASVDLLKGSTCRLGSVSLQGWDAVVTLGSGGSAVSAYHISTLRRELDRVYQVGRGTFHVELARRGDQLKIRKVLIDPLSVVLPWKGPTAYSVRRRAAIGMGDDTRIIKIPLSKHTLIAGETDSGKSGMLNVLIGEMVACSDASPRIVDLKGGVELRGWIPAVTHFEKDVTGAEELIEGVVIEMERRYSIMKGRFWIPSPVAPAIPLIIDEIAELSSKKAIGMLKTIARTGRAAAIYLVCATQYPTTEVIHSQIRGNFQNLIAMFMQKPEMCNVVFGDRGAKEGWDTSSFDQAVQGQFLVKCAGITSPRRSRAYWAEDAKITEVAEKYKRIPVGSVSVSVEKMDQLDTEIFSVLSASPSLSTAEILSSPSISGYSDRTVRYRLGRMVSGGLVEKTGGGRGTAPRWCVIVGGGNDGKA